MLNFPPKERCRLDNSGIERFAICNLGMEGKRGVNWSQWTGEMKKNLTLLRVNHNNYRASHKIDSENARVLG
jgi:hypothetical protein